MSSPQSLHWFHWLCYRLLKWLVVNPIFRLGFWGRVSRSTAIPINEPFIVVCNHASHLDPPLVANAVCRPVAFMAKAELFQIPVLNQLIRLYGAYPVKRGGADRKALQATEKALLQGWAVGIFLNGTRTLDARIHDPHLGAALISARTQIPLLPVALQGTQMAWPKGHRWPHFFTPLRIAIGEPIPPPASREREDLLATTNTCVDAIHALLDQLALSSSETQAEFQQGT